MKSIVIIILLMSEITVLNAGTAISKHCNEVMNSFYDDLLFNDQKNVSEEDSELDPATLAIAQNLPLEIIEHIFSFLPGNHPLVIRLVYKGILPVNTAENIVKAFKKSCTKTLRNHTIEKSLFDSDSLAIIQPKEFVIKKRKFLETASLFFKSCSREANKELINSILQANIQKMYPVSLIDFPMHCMEMIRISLPKEIKSMQEKAVLIAIAKSRDKVSKTTTIIYDYQKLYSINNDNILMRRLLPSIDWQSKDSLSYDMPVHSPYYKF